MSIILGINAYHGDSSACILIDGRMVAAVEEERIVRIKHWAGFPVESIKYCLAEANVRIADVEHIAINQNPKANLAKKAMFLLKNGAAFKLIKDRLSNRKKRSNIQDAIREAFPGESVTASFHEVEHHLCHLSSAFHVSPFPRATIVSVDGFGDFASTAWGIGEGTDILPEGKVFFPHSLGIFYQAMTQFIGFPHYGDEYKVMGLAPYGKPAYLEEMRRIVQLQGNGSFRLNMKYFRHASEKVAYEWEGGSPTVGTLFSDELETLLGPARKADESLEQKHKDIAHSIQAMYEEAFFHLLNHLHRQHGIENLAVAGGCGFNSVANGKIMLKTPFKHVYIQSAAGDAGGAIGAAFSVHHTTSDAQSDANGEIHNHAYWGPSYSNNDVEEAIKSKREEILESGCSVDHIDNVQALLDTTAAKIADGAVVGWYQGRLEWGPRALGNRSIVCDPRRDDMKELLNLKIKRRESFRPFAPSVLHESVSEWFEQDGDVPFMMQVYQIRESKRAKIPAVTHADGSGRLQSVYEDTNPRYYGLIKAFQSLTDVPMVLNTSFNENEPVVCTPLQALDCFLRTNMDVLVMEDWVLSRQ